ncbi:nitrate/nitrite transporter [Marinobacter sp.]|uniref:MFS transporter n=1 Tax=Marinobacter sp. TaxID=50741 RepID=UPI00384EC702
MRPGSRRLVWYSESLAGAPEALRIPASLSVNIRRSTNVDGTTSKADQRRALGLSTLAFTLCFAAWTLLSIIGVQLKQDLGLSESQLGLLMATPILTGAISRLIFGILADRFDGRRTFSLLMLVTSACVYLLTLASSYAMLLVAALGMGLAGGAFTAVSTYTAAWFEPGRRNAALGVLGAGNAGAGLTSLAAPLLLIALGWQATGQVYAAILAVMGICFLLFARDDPRAKEGKRHSRPLLKQLAPLGDIRVWRFSLYYFFVSGGFVALALWLPHYLMEVYGLGIVAAGMAAALYTIPAALFRIPGGWLSNRYGARRIMYWALGGSLVCTFLLSYPPTGYVIPAVDGDISFRIEMGLWGFMLLIFTLGFFMSLGKAAVFKHIPLYYPHHVGAVGGITGLIGGLGGFLLPLGFGLLSDTTGIWQSCFMLLFAIVACALLWMHHSIRKAERVEWGHHEEQTDLPELSTPNQNQQG